MTKKEVSLLSRVKNKRAHLANVQRKLRNLEDQLAEKRTLPKLQELVGTYWKYRNCYSCPEGEADRWWLFRKVVSLKGATLHCDEFQIDKYGKIEIELDKFTPAIDGEFNGGWHPITEFEWKEALIALMAKMKRLNKGFQPDSKDEK